MCECIVCGLKLTDLNEEWGTNNKGFQPSGGLEFATYGHYGSYIFDPMDGSTLRIVVCDSCIEFAIANKTVKEEPYK